LTAWTISIADSPVQGRRHLTGELKQRQELSRKSREYRVQFLLNLKPEHPLYHSPDARAARGEPMKA
jgi:hypothetical protein